ncbi:MULTISPECIES: hypothetical protein [Streptomyces]|uniref:hypothetical protein n=1 Tax=Streptomyces TaxID=1883 RepID=UPI0031E76922
MSGAVRNDGVGPVRGTGSFVLAVVESAVTSVLSMCWLLLALAISLESYGLDSGAPGRPHGHATLAWSACGLPASLGVTWLLGASRRAAVRRVADGVVAARLLAVLVVTALLTVDLLDGCPPPVRGARRGRRVPASPPGTHGGGAMVPSSPCRRPPGARVPERVPEPSGPSSWGARALRRP